MENARNEEGREAPPMTRHQEKFQKLYEEALDRIEHAKADGASESVIRYLEQSADGFRRQALQPRATRRSHATGRKDSSR